MDRPNPLPSVFTDGEIQSLRQGKCLVSHSSSDEFVSNVLTGSESIHRQFQSDLAEWYEVAKERGCEPYFHQRLRSTVNNRAAFLHTVGELMAGYFLYQHVDRGVEYRCAGSGADFTCTLEGTTVKFEAKTAVRDSMGPAPYCGPVDTLSPAIRSLLEQGRKRLRADDTNVLLVVCQCRPFVDVDDVLEAMYGTEIVEGTIDGFASKGLRGGKCGPNQMTRIGAVGVINRLGPHHLCAWFVHNVHARHRVPQISLDPWSQHVRTEDPYVSEWRNGTPDQARPEPGQAAEKPL